jgi:competence protein ComEA
MEKIPAKVQMIIVIFLGILIFFGGIKYNEMRLNSLNSDIINLTDLPMKNDDPFMEKTDAKDAKEKETKKELVVHVVGAVEKPGVYTFQEGDRVNEAIQRAVPLEEADLSQLNLALSLQDGKQLDVPFMDVQSSSVNSNNVAINNTSPGKKLSAQTNKTTKTATKSPDNYTAKTVNNPVVKTPDNTTANTTINDFGRATPADKIGSTDKKAGSTVQANTKININTAGKNELTTLPRIGPVLADRIIEYREKQGPFKKIEEITKVKGIGAATLEKFKDQITVE